VPETDYFWFGKKSALGGGGASACAVFFHSAVAGGVPAQIGLTNKFGVRLTNICILNKVCGFIKMVYSLKLLGSLGTL
jgi:hypothetical protein